MVGNYKVVTLCGSTRFKDTFMEVQKLLTLEGNIVISVGLFGHSGDKEVWEGMSEDTLTKTKIMLDDMHKCKIDMADKIFVINMGGYIGQSTLSEILYTKKRKGPMWKIKQITEADFGCEERLPNEKLKCLVILEDENGITKQLEAEDDWLRKNRLEEGSDWAFREDTKAETPATMQTETLSYYDQNAQNFVSITANIDFHETQDRFLSMLGAGAKILDFGCGSGRDTKYFLQKGFEVEAVDGSEELCRLASEFTGIKVKHMLFQELAEESVYDGIWACSSILHLSQAELLEVMQRMLRALKKGGVIYTSFKYGEFEGFRNGRYFIDMTEEKFAAFCRQIPGLQIAQEWTTSDARPGRSEENWLNLLLYKDK